MSIRAKTFLAIAVTLACAILALTVFMLRIVLGGFQAVENRQATQNVRRVIGAFEAQIGKLNFTARDWAVWSDTYRFVLNDNAAYIRTNLNAATVRRLNLNVMMFVKPDGVVTWGKALDLKTGRFAPMPSGFLKLLTPSGPLLHFASIKDQLSGVVVLPKGIMEIAARPILDSNGNGPSHGSLIFGHFLSAADVSALGRRVSFGLTFDRYRSRTLPPDMRKAKSSLGEARPVVVHPRSSSVMAGYALINDIYGRPAVVLRVTMPRATYVQAQRSIRYVVYALLSVGLLLILVVLFLLDRLVVARLSRLSREVKDVGLKGDLSARVRLPGRDELSGLAAAINATLEELEASLQREQVLEHRVEELRIEIDERKKAQEVASIVETDYFRSLERKAAEMRRRVKRDPGGEPA